MKNYLQFIAEGKVPALPSDLRKSYLKKSSINYKNIDMDHEGNLVSVSIWGGQVGKTDKYAIVMYSFDFGGESSIKSVDSEDNMERLFNKFKDRMKYDAALKLMK